MSAQFCLICVVFLHHFLNQTVCVSLWCVSLKELLILFLLNVFWSPSNLLTITHEISGQHQKYLLRKKIKTLKGGKIWNIANAAILADSHSLSSYIRENNLNLHKEFLKVICTFINKLQISFILCGYQVVFLSDCMTYLLVFRKSRSV